MGIPETEGEKVPGGRRLALARQGGAGTENIELAGKEGFDCERNKGRRLLPPF